MHCDLSPGTYLNWKLLERMFKDEIIYYSMGPGENEYKLRWSDTAISLSHITIYNKTFLNMVEYQLKTNVVPIINKIKMFLTKNDNVL